jgi:hypothetical protein
MPLGLLDVIWIDDVFIKPPGPKMMVCVEPNEGVFFRINTEDKWDTPVKILFSDNPNVLKHDSHIQCGSPLELDDYIINQSIQNNRLAGRLASVCIPELCDATRKGARMSPRVKASILKALGCCSA